jgi:hypothetical protein
MRGPLPSSGPRLSFLCGREGSLATLTEEKREFRIDELPLLIEGAWKRISSTTAAVFALAEKLKH